MNSSSRAQSPTGRRLVSLSTVLALAAGMTWLGGPATARPDPGDVRFAPIASTRMASWPPEGQCPLRRVGREYVHCDLLSGAGAVAPRWLPELYAADVA